MRPMRWNGKQKQKYHNVRKVLKYIIKIVERVTIDISNTQIHDP